MDRADLTGLMALMAFLPLLLVVLLLPKVFFLLTLQRALSRCSVESRTMSPGVVWLFLIPVFDLVWAFFIVDALSNSLHREFTRRGIAEEPQPGRSIGLAFAILAALSIVPVLNLFTGIAAFVCWILYWVKIAGYSARIAVPSTPAAA